MSDVKIEYPELLDAIKEALGVEVRDGQAGGITELNAVLPDGRVICIFDKESGFIVQDDPDDDAWSYVMVTEFHVGEFASEHHLGYGVDYVERGFVPPKLDVLAALLRAVKDNPPDPKPDPSVSVGVTASVTLRQDGWVEIDVDLSDWQETAYEMLSAMLGQEAMSDVDKRTFIDRVNAALKDNKYHYVMPQPKGAPF